ncbi:hypothetical protein E2A64_10115 [Pseudohoeflea suaedae]|uniref:Uncharacterized protein n=1 Tax=Pseudohoeflea suaedae TaxID=877384 RepID=A0A4R5PJC6_9HYPH|nr:hypothetical protein [Pseudohoeflea suaedae]TDH35686.1 hypothetical protein E2A64_10115 [Pseudohoeflea suaedae]
MMKLPGNFNAGMVRNILAGDQGYLSLAFAFCDTEQGVDFWLEQCGELTPEGILALKEMLAEYERQNGVELVEEIDNEPKAKTEAPAANAPEPESPWASSAAPPPPPKIDPDVFHEEFFRGELVCLRLSPDVHGIVIGDKDWGTSYLVRLKGSVTPIWFENCELLSIEPPFDGDDGESAEVINLDEYRAAKAAGSVH